MRLPQFLVEPCPEVELGGRVDRRGLLEEDESWKEPRDALQAGVLALVPRWEGEALFRAQWGPPCTESRDSFPPGNLD